MGRRVPKGTAKHSRRSIRGKHRVFVPSSHIHAPQYRLHEFNRNTHGKNASLGKSTFQRNASLQTFDGMFDNGKTKSCAAKPTIASPGRIPLIKPLKNPMLLLHCNPASSIAVHKPRTLIPLLSVLYQSIRAERRFAILRLQLCLQHEITPTDGGFSLPSIPSIRSIRSIRRICL